MQAAVLLLLAPDAPAVDLGSEDTKDMSEDEQRRQVVAALVGEIVLCVKEVNQKTRAAAYGLLVDLGQAMQEAHPPSLPDDLDAHMAGMELQSEHAHAWDALSRVPNDMSFMLALLKSCRLPGLWCMSFQRQQLLLGA